MMRRAIVPLLALQLLVVGCGRNPLAVQTSQPELQPVGIYRVDNGPRYHEPSGLIKVGQRFFTVCDKTDDTVFELVLEDGMMRMLPHIEFKPLSRDDADWEGITVGADGSFYLISESQGRMYQVGASEWATPDLREEGRKVGLFARANAHFEGITALGPDHFIGVAEREPRGLVEWKRTAGQWQVSAWRMDDSRFMSELPMLRVPDYSGLHFDGTHLYALFRGAHLLVRLERTADGWQETTAWSYASYERDPVWAYINQAYGQAEGLVVDGRDVYIIYDNNRGGRQSDPNDRTSLFLHLRIPQDPDPADQPG